MMSNTDVPRLAILTSARAVLSTSTRMLRSAGLADAADRAIRLATEAGPAPVVVFVGESGRGKTSVLNLLAPGQEGTDADDAGQPFYRVVTPAESQSGPLGGVVLSMPRAPEGLMRHSRS